MLTKLGSLSLADKTVFRGSNVGLERVSRIIISREGHYRRFILP